MKNSQLKKRLNSIVDNYFQYESNWSIFISPDYLEHFSKSENVLNLLNKKLTGTYPFFHPFYAGQMLKPPIEVASLAYFSAMMLNPNNHALDGGPSTSQLEKETVDAIAKMVGYKKYLGHLTSSGTIANLEGLWISKMLNPKSYFAICENAHYTHTRLSQVLNFKYKFIKMNDRGQMDIDHLIKIIKRGHIGTVIVTLGTTGFGALDPLHEILSLQKHYNFRIHVDAAYGGFFKILQNEGSKLIDSKPFKFLNRADSIVIDPHKHGLQPYGCGCILFRDPSVGKFYKHDSPYTYFTSKKLHLGEVSIECSRAGASAAALWATLKIFPLKTKAGLYKFLTSSRKAAIKFQLLVNNSSKLRLIVQPELDIVNFFPMQKSTANISRICNKIFKKLMERKVKPIYLSKYRIDSDFFVKLNPSIKKNSKEVVILRSALMKPEHEHYVNEIFSEIEKLS